MTSHIRTFEDQFEAPVARRIGILIGRVQSLRQVVPGGATKYYLYELASSLRVGLMLGALHLASTSLELFLRARISVVASTAQRGRPHSLAGLSYQQRLEESRKLKVADLLERLSTCGLFRREDVSTALEFYEKIRTPLAHGLLDRLENGRPNASEPDLNSLLGHLSGFTSQSTLESLLEQDALSYIETVVVILERNASYRAENDG